MNKLRPVFIADSCIGGLSVIKSLWNSGSAGDAVFLADYAINPLGVKSDFAIAVQFAEEIERLARLPAHAFFVNVGRSNVVDDVALINALQDDKLAGDALDVFDEEPLPQDRPLWDAPNLLITAHVAAFSHPALIAPVFVEYYRRYMRKEPLNYVIDFDSGY